MRWEGLRVDPGSGQVEVVDSKERMVLPLNSILERVAHLEWQRCRIDAELGTWLIKYYECLRV